MSRLSNRSPNEGVSLLAIDQLQRELNEFHSHLSPHGGGLKAAQAVVRCPDTLNCGQETVNRWEIFRNLGMALAALCLGESTCAKPNWSVIGEVPIQWFDGRFIRPYNHLSPTHVPSIHPRSHSTWYPRAPYHSVKRETRWVGRKS